MKLVLLSCLVVFSSSSYAQKIIIKSSFVFGSRVYWGWHRGPIINYSGFGIGHSFNPYYSYHLDKYAAISYSPSKNYYGWAWGKNSSRQAFFNASQECVSSDCKDLVGFETAVPPLLL